MLASVRSIPPAAWGIQGLTRRGADSDQDLNVLGGSPCNVGLLPTVHVAAY